MIRVISLLWKAKGRRLLKVIRNHKVSVALMLVSVIIFIANGAYSSLEIPKDYLTYLLWIANIYFVLKIINPTQGMVIDCQLIELKLISLGEFKLLLGTKLYGASLILLLLYSTIWSEKIILVLLLINCSINVHVFLRNAFSSRILDLVIAAVSCICIYLNSVSLAMVFFALTTFGFLFQKKNKYDDLLPLYRMTYSIGLRYEGEIMSGTETDDISEEAERLFGGKHESTSRWFVNYYLKDGYFYWFKELARIQANKDKLIMHIMISIVVCIGAFYLPQWYGIMAVAMCIMTAYNFCYVMFRADVKLFPYGFAADNRLWTIFRKKLPIYSVVCQIIMLPMAVVLRWWSWLMPVLSLFCAAASIVKSFK